MSAGKTRVTLKFSFKNNFSRRQMTQCQYDPGEGVRQTIISHLKVRLKCEPSLFKVLTPVTSAVQCILIQAPLLLRNSNWGFVKTRTVWEVEQSVTSCQTKQHFLSSSKTIKPRSDEAYFVDIKITNGRLGFYFLLQFSWRLDPVQPLNLGDNNVYHQCVVIMQQWERERSQNRINQSCADHLISTAPASSRQETSQVRVVNSVTISPGHKSCRWAWQSWHFVMRG